MRVLILALVLSATSACGNGPDMSSHGDELVWRGIHYGAALAAGRELTEADLGPVQTYIKHEVKSGRILLGERDAGKLPVGTPIHAVARYASTFRVAARVNGGVRLYEAGPHEGLTKGADLLDIEGQVVAIELFAVQGARFTRIERLDRVALLVRMVTEATVDMSPPWGVTGETVAITFELTDGTRTTRYLDRARARFADVLDVGTRFAVVVDDILSEPPCVPGFTTGC